MLKKTITYEDYNGVERKEDFYFNLSEEELMMMELGTTGGYSESIKKIVDSKDVPTIIKTFKEIILKSYGEKSDDGKRFRKIDENGKPLSIAFSQTEAYSKLFMELINDTDKAIEFVAKVVPAKLSSRLEDEMNKNTLIENN